MDFVDIFFFIIVFLFAISVHESAHAWMANKCGDPTARMLGRITLNPIKHIDPIGTILLPGLLIVSALATGHFFGIIGWAKPTPVSPENFQNPVRDDIFTTVAGPASNFLIAGLAIFGLAMIAVTSDLGRLLVHSMASGARFDTASVLMPLTYLLYVTVYLNVLLGIFNMLPVPPLDGSHVFRHMLPAGARRVYDTIGIFGLILLFIFGWPVIRMLMLPVITTVNRFLMGL